MLSVFVEVEIISFIEGTGKMHSYSIETTMTDIVLHTRDLNAVRYVAKIHSKLISLWQEICATVYSVN